MSSRQRATTSSSTLSSELTDSCLDGGGATRVVRTITDYAYDNSDRVVRRTFPDGKEALITFDGRGNVTEIKDVLGRVTKYDYDSKGRRTHTLFPDGTIASNEYDPAGRKKIAKDRGGRTVEYSWDTLDRLIKVILRNAQGGFETEESYGYDDAGRLISVTDALNRTSRIEYDLINQIRKVFDPVGQFVEYIHHPTKKLIVGVRDALGNTTHYKYDDLYRVESIETPDGQQTFYEYNNKGLLKRLRALNGATYTYNYDLLDRMTQVTDPVNRSWTFGYDGHGNRICRRDPNGNVTQFAYDEFNFGVLTSRMSPMGQTETYSYTDDFDLQSATDANGYMTHYAYENMSRFLKSVTPDINHGEPPIIFHNTPDGLVQSITQGSSVSNFTYGGLGEIKSDGINAYAYDLVGNLKRHQTPTGSTTYEYDNANRLSRTIGADGKITTYSYDDLSRLTTLVRPNGASTTYTYDVMSRVQTMTHTGTGFVLSYVHTYDVNGRLKSFSDETGVTTYSYDLVGQLQREESPRGITTYTYDSVGNRETKTVATAGLSHSFVYQYDRNDRLTSVSGPAGTTIYEYDANGNCIRAGSVTLGYDFTDYLTTVQLPTGFITYVYDSMGNRTAQITPEGTTRYLVSGGQVVEETAPDGTVTRYEYDGTMLRSLRNGQSSWFLEDAIGSTAGLVDGGGNLIDRWVYDAFGMPLRLAGNSGNSFLGIGGEQYDPITGLYYLRARYYDPQAGRFLSSDPLEGDDTYPLTLNKYAYAGSDPVNNSDPSGLSFTLGETNVAVSVSTQMRMAFFSGVNWADSINRYGVSSLQNPMTFFRETGGKILQQIAEEGWVAGLARAASHAHPLLSLLVATGENCYQTARSIEDAHRILMDPSASAEEKQMACYTVVFAFGEYAFNANQIAMNYGQVALSHRSRPARVADSIAEGEQVSPGGPRKRTVLESRVSSVRAGGIDGSKKFTRRELRVFNEGPCFPAEVETVVIRPISGKKPTDDATTSVAKMSVRDVAEGDWAATRDALTGGVVWRQVTHKFVRRSPELLKLSFALASDPTRSITETLRTTPEHPFYVSGEGWVSAGELGIGTCIVTRAGPQLIVVGIERQYARDSTDADERANGFPVYNFSVDEHHSYFVGNTLGGAWVHNAGDNGNCFASSLRTLDMSNSDWTKVKFRQGPLVYVIHDADSGEILKVGQTHSETIKGRFRPYGPAAIRDGRKILIDVFEYDFKSARGRVGALEKEIRDHLMQVNSHRVKPLPWDHSKGTGRKGSGLP